MSVWLGSSVIVQPVRVVRVEEIKVLFCLQVYIWILVTKWVMLNFSTHESSIVSYKKVTQKGMVEETTRTQVARSDTQSARGCVLT